MGGGSGVVEWGSERNPSSDADGWSRRGLGSLGKQTEDAGREDAGVPDPEAEVVRRDVPQ